MSKKIAGLLLVGVMAASLIACGGDSSEIAAAEEGKVFNIYAWNEEFKGFFEKYYTVPEDVTVNWIITPYDGGAYQQKLDEALLSQSEKPDDEKVDLFLAEADYIQKYVDSDATQDITALGVTDFSNTYNYTVQAATNEEGVIKGVSFQCCPSALIYRRSIAEDVFGVSEPDEVQPFVDSWEKFNKAADDAKAKGYYMTACFAETYRAFSNNAEIPWVDENNRLQFDPQIEAWIEQTDEFVSKGETLTSGIWDEEKNVQMFKDGKTMCFFGPAWYFNFCMGNAQDPEKGCYGDWAICEGPAAHFWGGTWLLAPTGTDNPLLAADIMNTFINDEEVCNSLISEESQFTNNQKVNMTFAEDPEYGNAFLGGQNDVALFAGMADDIVWQNHTIYDQLLNEGLQTNLQEYYKGQVDKETALENFYKFVAETYPAIKIDNM